MGQIEHGLCIMHTTVNMLMYSPSMQTYQRVASCSVANQLCGVKRLQLMYHQPCVHHACTTVGFCGDGMCNHSGS